MRRRSPNSKAAKTRPKRAGGPARPARRFQHGGFPISTGRVHSGPLFGASKMVSLREKHSIVKKQLAHRELTWPGCEPQLWHRKGHKGYATIPKTMPLVVQIMDNLSGKGKPVSPTYLSL